MTDTPEKNAPHLTSPNMGERARRLALPVSARICVALGLTTVLIWYLDPEKVIVRIAAIDVEWAVLACAVLAGQYALAAARWHYVLRRHGVGLRGAQVQAIYGAGALANLAALTAIAGMSVRGVLMVRKGAKLSRIVGVLFVERFSALAGFGLCFAVGLATALPLLRDELAGLHVPEYARLVVATGVAVAAVAGLVLMRLRAVRKLLDEIRESFLSTGAVLALAALSCVIVWLGFAAVAVLARGMSLEVNPIFFLVVMPVVAFLSALPVSLGGWGVREGAMVAGLLLFGVPADAGAALSIAYGALGTVVTLILAGASLLLLRPGPADGGSGVTDPVSPRPLT